MLLMIRNVLAFCVPPPQPAGFVVISDSARTEELRMELLLRVQGQNAPQVPYTEGFYRFGR